MKPPKSTLIFIFVLIFLLAGGLGYYFWNQEKIKNINSFDECAAAGYPIMDSYPEQCRTPDGKNFTRQISGQEITVTGEFVCLPHKDKEGPQTLECAFGIKDESGSHYALSDPDFKYTTALATGSKITIKGKFKSDPTSKYDILGIVEIESLSKN